MGDVTKKHNSTPTTFRSINGFVCHPCITTTHLSYSVLSLKLPPRPWAVLLVFKKEYKFRRQKNCSCQFLHFVSSLIGHPAQMLKTMTFRSASVPHFAKVVMGCHGPLIPPHSLSFFPVISCLCHGHWALTKRLGCEMFIFSRWQVSILITHSGKARGSKKMVQVESITRAKHANQCHLDFFKLFSCLAQRCPVLGFV